MCYNKTCRDKFTFYSYIYYMKTLFLTISDVSSDVVFKRVTFK